MSFSTLLSRADALALDKLGESVTYTPGVGASVSVRGVFDAAYVRVEGGEAGVSSTGPALFLRLAGLPSDPVTDLDARATVGGQDYTIREAEPDGQGAVRLLLQKV